VLAKKPIHGLDRIQKVTAWWVLGGISIAPRDWGGLYDTRGNCIRRRGLESLNKQRRMQG